MQKQLTMREANQRFTECVRDVEESGDEIVITRHGQPVARLVPVAKSHRVLMPSQQAALQELRAIWANPPAPGASENFDRDSLYDRDRRDRDDQ